jgi:hypothetical protein
VEKTGVDLIASVLTRSRARLHFYCEEACILLNADEQEYDRNGDHLIRGSVHSNRKVVLRKLKNEGFRLSRCSMPLIECREKGSVITFVLGPVESTERMMSFTSGKNPKSAAFNSKPVDIIETENGYLLNLPEFKDQAEVSITF